MGGLQDVTLFRKDAANIKRWREDERNKGSSEKTELLKPGGRSPRKKGLDQKYFPIATRGGDVNEQARVGG